MRTKLPDETEQALYRATDARWWPYINLYLVTWGQNVCRPVYPRCGDCVIAADCPRIGVENVGRVLLDPDVKRVGLRAQASGLSRPGPLDPPYRRTQ